MHRSAYDLFPYFILILVFSVLHFFSFLRLLTFAFVHTKFYKAPSFVIEDVVARSFFDCLP